MSEASTALPKYPDAAPDAPPGAAAVVTELKASAHLMSLDAGVFCITQSPRPAALKDGSGLPGVRISAPPGPVGNCDAVEIRTFRDDGWLTDEHDAALVRITEGPAQILVTIYQSAATGAHLAPRLQVTRLTPEPVRGPEAEMQAGPIATDGSPAPEMVAHIARAGDVGGKLGEWIGVKGSKQWIEGFGLSLQNGIAPEDVEYQAVLGRGWLSPWIEGGKFCGSRGMALPLLGLRVRLRGTAAEAYECSYAATFVDGAEIGPVPAGEVCEADSLAPLEAFQIVVRPKAKTALAPTTPSQGPPGASRGVRIHRSARRSR